MFFELLHVVICPSYTRWASPSGPTPPVTCVRASAPRAGIFDAAKKVLEYNKKFAAAAGAQAFDKRRARASHVLLTTTGADTEAWFELLKGKIESGELTLEEAAAKHSTCPSKSKGGDLGLFGPGASASTRDRTRAHTFSSLPQTPPRHGPPRACTVTFEFDAAVFDDSVPVGQLQILKTKFGTHLMQVTERSSKDEEEEKSEKPSELGLL